MRHYRLSLWTGPTLVRTLADKLRAAGVIVVVEGTEHVYVNMDGSDHYGAAWNVLAALCRTHGTDFGLRPRVMFLLTHEHDTFTTL